MKCTEKEDCKCSRCIEIDRMLEHQIREEFSMQVIYNPDCGCQVDQFVLLDRFPMSEKIISSCPNCKKGCLMEINDPIIFYDQLEKKDIQLEELINYVITDSWQKPYLDAYKTIALAIKLSEEE